MCETSWPTRNSSTDLHLKDVTQAACPRRSLPGSSHITLRFISELSHKHSIFITRISPLRVRCLHNRNSFTSELDIRKRHTLGMLSEILPEEIDTLTHFNPLDFLPLRRRSRDFSHYVSCQESYVAERFLGPTNTKLQKVAATYLDDQLRKERNRHQGRDSTRSSLQLKYLRSLSDSKDRKEID